MEAKVEVAIEPKPTLSEIVKKRIGTPKVVPYDSYEIVIATIYNYKKLSTKDKEKIKANEKKVAKQIMEKFSPLVIYMNIGNVIIIFPKREKGQHMFGGDINITKGCINSYLTHLFCDIIDNTWFVTEVYGEREKKDAYAYMLYLYRQSIRRSKELYVNDFPKEELEGVKYDKLDKKMEYIYDLIGYGYDKEENMGYFTKYKKEENPESKFGFDRRVVHIQRDIYFNDRDIDYLMQDYV